MVDPKLIKAAEAAVAELEEKDRNGEVYSPIIDEIRALRALLEAVKSTASTT